MASKKPSITRVRIAREELEKLSKEDLHKCWNLQDQYVDLLENKLNTSSDHSELLNLRESEEKLKQQQIEATRRENILVMRLTTKEHEMQEFAGQIQELKQAQVPSISQLRSALLDPAVNLLFEKMRKEMETLKARLEETQNELRAWKFTPDSNTGKRLMAKCRLLYQENEELGKIISSGRMAKLEGDLALQKSFSEEMKKSQSELDEFLLELDEDVEGMQSTIYYLQQQLREAKEQIQVLQKERLDPSNISNSPLNQSNDTFDVNDISLQHFNTNTNEVKFDVASIPKLNGTENTTDKSVKSEIMFHVTTSNSELDSRQSINELKELDSETSLKLTIADNAVPLTLAINKTANHDKDVLQSERTNKVDHSELRTDDYDMESNVTGASDSERKVNTVDNLKCNKLTSDGSRGRKRGQTRTSVEAEIVNDKKLPVRKRARRRKAELIQNFEESRTKVEIDTDTEVQVAQTLASWASTKQERTEVKTDLDMSLGNGEVMESYNNIGDS